MEYITKGIAPEKVLGFFEDICAVPHGSGNIKRIADFIENFARTRNLKTYRDSLDNIIIIKPATDGFENAEPVIIQGHMDMVCEKNADCKKDMQTEGLDIRIKDDFIYAEGTTLGGDDGAAVAMAMALIDSNDIPHPELQIIITTDEETGMDGAVGLDVSAVSARKMINLDSESEGVFTVGCAGGNRTECAFCIKREAIDGTVLKITVKGLKGGHSGEMITCGRANSSVTLGRALAQIDDGDIRIIRADGGLKDNAIPVESTAYICAENPDKVKETLKSFIAALRKEYQSADEDITLICEDSACPMLPMDKESTEKIITLLTCMPNGLIELSMDVPGLAQTSLNLGMLWTEQDSVTLSYCVRSSVASQKEMLKQRLARMTKAFNGSIRYFGDYPAWEFKKESPLRELMTNTYREMYNKEPIVTTIHGGLECGLLSDKLPGLDCVSFGPDIYDIHTPRERMSMSSLNRTWEFLCEVLKRCK